MAAGTKPSTNDKRRGLFGMTFLRGWEWILNIKYGMPTIMFEFYDKK